MNPGTGSLLGQWNRYRVEEILYRQMCYIRDHYTFGAAYRLSRDLALIAYVRRDSPHAEDLIEVLGRSGRANIGMNLSKFYVNDPRQL